MPAMSNSTSPLEDLDKMSELPDDILLNVLSALELKDAGQTSLISKRWRYLWTWRTDLNFDPTYLSPNKINWTNWWMPEDIRTQRYLNWIDQVIVAHCGSFISKFRVFFSCFWGKDTSRVEKWIKFAFSKRVEDLDLNFLFYRNPFKFSLGFELLKHPPYCYGILNLKSLRLQCVNVSGEVLEFIVSHCLLLEQLYVDDSETLQTLNIKSCKLKHLTLYNCDTLKEVVFDATNLISFYYKNSARVVNTHMVFKSVPKLVEMGFIGEVCVYPFQKLEQFPYMFKQLTKLSFHPTFSLKNSFVPPVEIALFFPNVKQLTLTVQGFFNQSIVFAEVFIDACPMLLEVKLQINWFSAGFPEEAKQLQVIELEYETKREKSASKLFEMDQHYSHTEFDELNGREMVEGTDWMSAFQEYENDDGLPHLKVLEIVGFRGCDADVGLALDEITRSNIFETLICDPRDHFLIGTPKEFSIEGIDDVDIIRRRAHKLAKILPPEVNIVII